MVCVISCVCACVCVCTKRTCPEDVACCMAPLCTLAAPKDCDCVSLLGGDRSGGTSSLPADTPQDTRLRPGVAREPSRLPGVGCLSNRPGDVPLLFVLSSLAWGLLTRALMLGGRKREPSGRLSYVVVCLGGLLGGDVGVGIEEGVAVGVGGRAAAAVALPRRGGGDPCDRRDTRGGGGAACAAADAAEAPAAATAEPPASIDMACHVSCTAGWLGCAAGWLGCGGGCWAGCWVGAGLGTGEPSCRVVRRLPHTASSNGDLLIRSVNRGGDPPCTVPVSCPAGTDAALGAGFAAGVPARVTPLGTGLDDTRVLRGTHAPSPDRAGGGAAAAATSGGGAPALLRPPVTRLVMLPCSDPPVGLAPRSPFVGIVVIELLLLLPLSGADDADVVAVASEGEADSSTASCSRVPFIARIEHSTAREPAAGCGCGWLRLAGCGWAVVVVVSAVARRSPASSTMCGQMTMSRHWGPVRS